MPTADVGDFATLKAEDPPLAPPRVIDVDTRIAQAIERGATEFEAIGEFFESGEIGALDAAGRVVNSDKVQSIITKLYFGK